MFFFLWLRSQRKKTLQTQDSTEFDQQLKQHYNGSNVSNDSSNDSKLLNQSLLLFKVSFGGHVSSNPPLLETLARVDSQGLFFFFLFGQHYSFDKSDYSTHITQVGK